LKMANTELDKGLFKAAYEGDVNGMKEALELGAEVDVKDEMDMQKTALIKAVENNNLDAAKFLIEKGAEVNSKDTGEQTSLLHAVYQQNVEMIKELIKAGADPNHEKEGQTIIDIAKDRSLEVLKAVKGM